jgi:hydroxymethylpyrimidine pyrophosphatase-like HAD family hydrolase
MLEFAGHPVIMGNACEELRSRGWTVTLGNDACGIAAAVDMALGDLATVAGSSVLGLRS